MLSDPEEVGMLRFGWRDEDGWKITEHKGHTAKVRQAEKGFEAILDGKGWSFGVFPKNLETAQEALELTLETMADPKFQL
jgi:hypothetical protein